MAISSIDDAEAGQSWVEKSVAGGQKIPSTSYFPTSHLITLILSPLPTLPPLFLQSSRSTRTTHPPVAEQRKGR